METIWLVSLAFLWVLVLLNLLLTLRVVRWLRAMEDLRLQDLEREKRPELPINSAAPDFKAKTIEGEVVRLATYLGRSVVFIFVSPHCSSCRKKMPRFVRLSTMAKERTSVEFILVSDSSTQETYSWINTMHEEDGVLMNIPVLVAPRNVSEFLTTYNPRGLSPYYCLINEEGIVLARGPVDMGEWLKLQQEWEGTAAVKNFSRVPKRYQQY